MKNRILWRGFTVFVAVAMVLAFAANAGASPAKLDKKLKLVFVSHLGPESEWEAKVIKGWNDAMETLGAEVVGETYFGKGDHSKTMDLVRTAITKGCDGLLVLSYDLPGTEPLLRQGLSKGIQIVTAAMRAPGFSELEIPSTGLDYTAQGYISGTYNAAQFKTAAPGRKVKIAFFAEMVSEYSVKRRAGMLKAFDDAGVKYDAGDILETSMDLSKNLDMIKSYLMTHRSIDAIVCLGSVSTPAGAMAMKDLKYKPGQLRWTGYDLSPQGEEGIRAGYGAINVDEAYNHGFFGAMILYLRLKHGLFVGHLPIFSSMVDQSNIDKFTTQSGQ